MPDAISVKHRTIYSSLPLQVFMIHAIKKPLLTVAGLILNKLPEPTKDNTWHPNSHNLIDIRDAFFKHCILGGDRERFIKAVFNFVIILYDFDPPWRWMIDFVKDMALKMEWKPRGYEDTWTEHYTWWREDV